MKVGQCGLCHEPDKYLQASHFLAAGFLRRLRGNESGNQNPYLMSLNWVGQTSKSAMQPLLCKDCEARFNTNGERWVIANAYDPTTGNFTLRERLVSAKPIHVELHGSAYDASHATGVEIEKLVYFGASVIWRAAVRSWQVQKERYEQFLIEPKYEEELRLYLLGKAPFPVNAISAIYVSPSQEPPLFAQFPDRLEEQTHVTYRFYVPGLWFLLILGESLTEDMRKMCILRSSVHPLSLWAGGDTLLHTISLNLYQNKS